MLNVYFNKKNIKTVIFFTIFVKLDAQASSQMRLFGQTVLNYAFNYTRYAFGHS